MELYLFTITLFIIECCCGKLNYLSNNIGYLIVYMIFPIGLDITIKKRYIQDMRFYISNKSSTEESKKRLRLKSLIEFADNQFKALAKKNLRPPIKLYQL